MFAMFSIVCFLLIATQVLSDSVQNESKLMPNSPPILVQTLMSSLAPFDSYTDNRYESVNSSYITVTEDMNVVKEDSYGSTGSSGLDSPQSSTVMTPYELYRSNWCNGMLRSSAPKEFPNSSNLTQFEEKYVIPEYRSLWYRTCYMPYRGVGIASILFDRGMGLANTAIRTAVGSANNAFGSNANVSVVLNRLRDMLVSARLDTN